MLVRVGASATRGARLLVLMNPLKSIGDKVRDREGVGNRMSEEGTEAEREEERRRKREGCREE